MLRLTKKNLKGNYPSSATLYQYMINEKIIPCNSTELLYSTALANLTPHTPQQQNAVTFLRLQTETLLLGTTTYLSLGSSYQLASF